jgi:undecaprenyl-diphosphatase
VRKLRLCLAALLLPHVALTLHSAPAQSDPKSAPLAVPAAELGMRDAIILGVVEGVTEFLPVSSTGHLIVTTRLLGLDSDTPLVSADGEPLWFRKPSEENPAGVPLTLKLAADTFTIVVQFGAIAAVALLYWSRFISMLNGLLGRDPAGLRLLINVLIAFAPAAVLGLLLNDWIDRHLFSVGVVCIALVVGAGLMLYAEHWRRRNRAGTEAEKHGLRELTPASAAIIGLLQCLALWPGMSRSMTTIVGGYFVGLEPRRAAEFSFLLGFVTLTAASAYKSLKSGTAMIDVFGWPSVVLGAIVAAVTAGICVRFLVHWLSRHGLGLFAWYRIGVAAILAWVYYV